VLVTRPQRIAILILISGAACTSFAALRTAPWLLFLNRLTACALAVLAASYPREAAFVTAGARGFVLRLARAFLAILRAQAALQAYC